MPVDCSNDENIPLNVNGSRKRKASESNDIAKEVGGYESELALYNCKEVVRIRKDKGKIEEISIKSHVIISYLIHSFNLFLYLDNKKVQIIIFRGNQVNFNRNAEKPKGAIRMKIKKGNRQVFEFDPLFYIRIKENIPIKPVKLFSDASIEVCSCSPNDEAPCSIKSYCLNANSSIECDPELCPAKEKCQNQHFRKGLLFTTEIKRTPSKGLGLFTCDPIPKHDFIIEYLGEVIDNKEFTRRFRKDQEAGQPDFYFLNMGHNHFIDSRRYGNESRFMNHCCEGNCAVYKWTAPGGETRIGIFAKRNILPVSKHNFGQLNESKLFVCFFHFSFQGEELTFDYDWQSTRVCYCGTISCRGFI